MRVRALRGVCVGVDRHLKPGDIEDLDAGQVTFLVGIGAVEVVPEPVQQTNAAEETKGVEVSKESKEPADANDDKDPQQLKAGKSGKRDGAGS